MKTIKPQKLGLLHRCFEYQHRFYFGVSVLMFIPLTGEADLFSEASMWTLVAEELGKEGVLEASIPKKQSEFLATGFAFPPGGQPSPGCVVRIALGDREKALNVFGDRFWNQGRISKPEPFSRMKLNWQRAYGGEGFAANPIGRGYKPVAGEQGKVHWLPNVQYPTETVFDRSIGITPAGFGPLEITWPQRFAKVGTYNQAWLEEDFPAFARDIDWAIFNTASTDQWFGGYLRGDEPYRLENLHPEKPVIEGRLPGYKARCHVTRRTKAGEVFKEIPTKLATVWFFPHRERAVVVHQGFCEISDEDGDDIVHLIIGAERLSEPRSQAYYVDVLEKRLDKDKGMLFALKDSLLVPDGLPDSGVGIPPDEDLIRKRMRQRTEREIASARAVAASHGLDPDVHAPKKLLPEEPPPDLEHFPEFMAKLEQEAEKQKNEARQSMAESEKRMEKLFVSLDMDYEEIRKEYTEKPTGLPDFSAQSKIELLEEMAEQQRQQKQDTEEIEGYLTDEGFRQRLFHGEQQLKETYRTSAHLQEPAPRRQDEAAARLRQQVVAIHSRGDSLAGLDLTGIDLSGLDLVGADFENAFLESVNFGGANLEGVNFHSAVLAHANLTATRLTGANLSGANLGKANCMDCNAEVTDCRDAILAKADLTGASFKGADLNGCDCSGAIYKNTDFSNVRAAQLTFLETDLRGLDLSGAHLHKCIFLKVDVTGVDFSAAFLEACVFLEAVGRHCRFNRADMTNVRFVGQSVFDASNFSGACLNDANLRGVSLQDCIFSEAQLNSADFSECNLQNANFYRAVGRDVSFVKANLNSAIMVSLNAMQGTLQRADIRGADLRGANLYAVDMARVYADSRTQLGDTFTKKIRIYPKRVTPHES